MNLRHKFLAQRGVNGAVTGQPAHVLERLGADPDAEMALAAFLVTGVAAVAFALVLDVEFARLEGLVQPSADFLGS